MKAMLVMLALLSGASLAAEPNPEAENFRRLAAKMKELEAKLREDRHDLKTQIEGRLIESAMDRIIERQEKQQQQQQQKKEQSQKQQQQKQEQQQQAKQQSQSPGNSQSKVDQGPTDAPAGVVGNQSKWAKLPKAMRDEMLQSYGQEMPEKWRKRLEAYFYSINVDEAEKEKRK